MPTALYGPINYELIFNEIKYSITIEVYLYEDSKNPRLLTEWHPRFCNDRYLDYWIQDGKVNWNSKYAKYIPPPQFVNYCNSLVTKIFKLTAFI